MHKKKSFICKPTQGDTVFFIYLDYINRNINATADSEWCFVVED